MASTSGLQYTAPDANVTAMNRGGADLSMPAAATGTPLIATGHIPADFDVAGFVRNAKLGFIRLQAANDAGNLADIRDFTTPEMFAEIRMNIADRGNATQETEVVIIDAEVLDITEEETRYLVSARFTGLIRDDRDAAAETVDEIWHLVKPRDGQTGWVLAGIQQAQQAA